MASDPSAQPRVYLNGEWLALSNAKVSVLDRGFLFADGVYEVIPAYAGRLFRLEEHIQRLDNSLRSIQMQPVMSLAQWKHVLDQLIAEHAKGSEPQADLSIYLQVTRGAGAQRDHSIPSTIEPTVFAMAQPIASHLAESAAKGIEAITMDDIRWQWCHIKSIALLGNVLLKDHASQKGCAEAILIRDGLATEGSASNLFVVKDQTLITPPKSHHLLPGITRDLVLELAHENGLDCLEQDIPSDLLNTVDEIWMTSSTREIMPVVTLDGHAVASGQPGPMWKRMTALYADYKQRLRDTAG